VAVGLTSGSSEICARRGSPQDLALSERRKHDAARGAVESPESLSLARRQAQSWQFAVLTLRPTQEIGERRRRVPFTVADGFGCCFYQLGHVLDSSGNVRRRAVRRSLNARAGYRVSSAMPRDALASVGGVLHPDAAG
jgi:hypothetical protein